MPTLSTSCLSQACTHTQHYEVLNMQAFNPLCGTFVSALPQGGYYYYCIYKSRLLVDL